MKVTISTATDAHRMIGKCKAGKCTNPLAYVISDYRECCDVHLGEVLGIEDPNAIDEIKLMVLESAGTITLELPG